MNRLKSNLDKIYAGKNLLTINAKLSDRFVIFSDLHRGKNDIADDFTKSNQESYQIALDYYLENNYHLIHLGDIEELKEQWDVVNVIGHNKRHLDKEVFFHHKNQYSRVFGNHDNKYEDKSFVQQYLHPYFKDLKVYEGIKIIYGNLPDIFMVHGHQDYLPIVTNLFEYIGLPIYRFWINNISKKNRDTFYDSYCDIDKAENEMYNWTKEKQNLITIFGHTHKPLWGRRTEIEKYQMQIKTLQYELRDISHGLVPPLTINELIDRYKLEALESEIMILVKPLFEGIQELLNKIKIRMERETSCAKVKSLPLLFNSGCCIFKDGNITGIEIDNGEIRLIKWGLEKSTGRVGRSILERDYLDCLII